MPVTLTKPSVDANALEASVMALWQEFLAGHFDGQPHAIGATNGVVFPLAELAFQQSALAQPLDTIPAPGLAITVVWSETLRKRSSRWENIGGARQEIAQEPTAFNFWVRATGPNARRDGKTVADLLYGLLNNSYETRVLAQKGMQCVGALTPRAIQDSDYCLRLLTVTARLRYPILSQVETVAAPDDL